MQNTVRNLAILLGVAGAVLALTYGLASLNPARPPRAPLEIPPAEASVVMHVDAAALRQSPIWEALVGGSGAARIERVCGFDPLDQVRDVVVFVIGSEGRPLEHVGFVARGAMDPEALGACVRAVVEEDGGGVREEELDGIRVMASAHGNGRAAFIAPGVLVGGDETVIRAAVAVDRQGAPSAASDEILSAAYRSVEARGDLVLAAHVPPNWQSFFGRLGADVGLRGLEGARALALGARLIDGLGLSLAVSARDEDHAGLLARSLASRRDAALEIPLLGGTEAAEALRTIEVEARGDEVIATLDMDEARLTAVVAFARMAVSQARAAADLVRLGASMVPPSAAAAMDAASAVHGAAPDPATDAATAPPPVEPPAPPPIEAAPPSSVEPPTP